MHRLFVAIRPPRPIREQLLAVMGGVRNARWQSDEQLHLTLRFIGEVDRHQAEDIHAALAAIRHPGFEIALAGIGRFGRPGQPGSLWAGVSPHEPLKALHHKVDQAVTRAGVPPERRAFAPHITLARLKRDAGPIDGLLAHSGGLSSPLFAVDAFALYESELTPDGAIYSVVERFDLG
ncbi:RNA 2',3'-cyclic phosphodiesterase [Sphingomonas sp. LY54]|uniref:RNA 2',3'-cyclic phosphodiesterase n=1 Tax=Sphingomonas sp. LY54 TaxID=3095343 RepID=UPI002D769ADE|nr:RNA 2',3'-cyclic phosphodiesterase [Sphingomonas sp. LY54]WRP29532.1 RNA 2',3'-cyclic phosphodiesterase [Sphingomonas sp. LY54]